MFTKILVLRRFFLFLIFGKNVIMSLIFVKSVIAVLIRVLVELKK